MHAVVALERLQDPSDKADPVCQEMLRMLRSDPSHLVRRAVVTHLGISKYTLKAVLERTKDIKEEVSIYVKHGALKLSTLHSYQLSCVVINCGRNCH